MSTITTINAADQISASRTVINTNFANLNADKVETSVIDTDTTMAANSDAKIPSQKAIKAYVDAQQDFSVSTETTAGTTHSLTTDGTQRVLVTVTGEYTGTGSAETILLNYNAVAKYTLNIQHTNTWKVGFCMQYTETPAAATQNITVTSGGTLADVVITVLKFNV